MRGEVEEWEVSAYSPTLGWVSLSRSSRGECGSCYTAVVIACVFQTAVVSVFSRALWPFTYLIC